MRAYELADFDALYELDQSCFPPRIAYSNTMLRYFLKLSPGTCLLAADRKGHRRLHRQSVNAPLAHIITLDIAEAHRRSGIGSIS